MKNIARIKYLQKMRWALSYVAPLVLLFSLRSSLADQYYIPSGSMRPTIQVGDHVWVNKAAYGLRVPFTDTQIVKTGEPRRGDVVVFEDPRNPSITLIKRLIGMPGDVVEISDGIVSINGARLATSLPPQEIERRLTPGNLRFVYAEGGDRLPRHLVQRLPEIARAERRRLVVPPGMYFFLGDNRDNSADSRVWGFAARRALLGRASRILYSVRWDGLLPRPTLSRAGLAL